jgi:hypothetical protein
MALIIYILIIILNLIPILFGKKSVIVQVATLFVICALFVGSRGTGDLDNYIQMYEYDLENLRGVQFAYWGMMDFCKSINLTFYQFRFVVTSVSLVLLYVFFRKTSLNPHVVLIAYLLSVFFMDDIQIRNFIADSYLYMGLIFIYSQNKNWKTWLSLFIVLASLNHVLFLAYFVLLLYKANIKFINYYTLALLFLTVFLVFNKDQAGFLVKIMSFVDSEKADIYSESTTRYGALMIVGIQVMTLFMINYLMKHSSSRYDGKLKVFFQITYRLNLMISICLPLMVIDFNFYRLLRTFVLVNVICVSNLLYVTRKPYVFYFMVLYVLMWVDIDLLSADNFSQRVVRVFENNTLKW